MRTLAVVLSLFITVTACASRLSVDRARPLEPVTSERLAGVLSKALAVFNLADGSQWITHFVPARMEPSAIGVTRFARDGSARVFLLADWLPAGTIPKGWCGQIFGVALLDDGRIAVSGAWTGGHVGIFILRARADGAYDTDRMFEPATGVARIVAGPRNTILAVTYDSMVQGGGPLVTLFDTEGHVLGKAEPIDRPRSVAETVQNASDARLVRISDRQYAVYERGSETIHVWDIDREGSRGSVWAGVANIFVGDDAGVAGVPVIDIVPAGPRAILVVRTGRIRGKVGTLLTVYNYRYEVTDEAFTEHPWNFLIPGKGTLRGVVLHGTPHFDTVAFE